MTRLTKLYEQLRKKYGQPSGQWTEWCQRPKTKEQREMIIIGAVLTQRTNWKNVELALNNLKRAGLNSLKDIYRLGLKKPKELAQLIKPSGFYQQKVQRLLDLIEYILKNYQGLTKMRKRPFQPLREELLRIKGIGPETADGILLYALDKPVFVVDQYTQRWVRKKRLTNKLNYADLQRFFEKRIKKDYRLYQDFHALIVIEGKNQ